MLFTTLLVATLGVIGTVGQLTNSTLFSILNTTQLSPAYKFIQLLQSSPDYQPILSLLSEPGNVTLFAPSDAVFDRLIQEFNSTQQQQQQQGSQNGTSSSSGGGQNGNNSTSSSNGGGTGGGNQTSSVAQFIDGDNTDSDITQQPASSSPSSNGSQEQNIFPSGFYIYNNFTVADIIYYHVLQEKVLLSSQSNQTSIFNSMLTNQTVNKFGYAMPLILNSNATQQNTSSSSGSNNGTSTSDGSNGGSSNGTSSTNTTSTGSNPSALTGGWISKMKRLVTRQTSPSSSSSSSSSSSMSNDSQRPVYWIGNGLSSANVTLHDIEASNGVLHIIDNVLIPPGNATNVISNISDASAISEMIQGNPQVNQALSNATNVTIFAPNDKGLCMVCIDQLGQDRWRGLIMNHVVPGIYYSTNLTEGSNASGNGNGTSGNSSGGSSSMTLMTGAGESLPISVNSSGIILNDTITVVQPNILFNGGVIHLIDKVISPPTNTTPSNNGTAAGPTVSSSSSAAAAATESSTSPAPAAPPTQAPNSGGTNGGPGDGGNPMSM